MACGRGSNDKRHSQHVIENHTASHQYAVLMVASSTQTVCKVFKCISDRGMATRKGLMGMTGLRKQVWQWCKVFPLWLFLFSFIFLYFWVSLRVRTHEAYKSNVELSVCTFSIYLQQQQQNDTKLKNWKNASIYKLNVYVCVSHKITWPQQEQQQYQKWLSVFVTLLKEYFKSKRVTGGW